MMEASLELLKFVLGFEAEENKTKQKQFIPESQCNFFCFIALSLDQPSMNSNNMKLAYYQGCQKVLSSGLIMNSRQLWNLH